MLWVKAFHLIFVVTWFAGLFYLPRLFVYHAMAEDTVSRQRFEVMERKLYYGIMAPGAVLTVVFGLWLWLGYDRTGCTPSSCWSPRSSAIISGAAS
jgi:putative membrane protein